MISYDRLWITMRSRGETTYTLIKNHNVSPGQISRLKRNQGVSTHTINMFCNILKCDIGDILEYINIDSKGE
ncbi:MAG: helix-turn-helix transcriptional regulator [Lachnospiraceae bacterium]|nr:helix-turn-helix transcriptional regulator [Lachnospiraceae bacterium]